MDNEEKINRVFQMTPDTAMVYFLLVKWTTDHGVTDTVKLREYILNWLAEHDQMQMVYDTKRSEEQIIADYKKQGLKVDDRRNYVPNRNTEVRSAGALARFYRELVRLFKVYIVGDS